MDTPTVPKSPSLRPSWLLLSALDGEILCAAGIRTAQTASSPMPICTSDFSTAFTTIARINVPAEQIMEVVSLASTTPFPVLPMLDRMIEWGRENGMTCGVFTATAPLRRLLRRTGFELCGTGASRTDLHRSQIHTTGEPITTRTRRCAHSARSLSQPAVLSPRARAAQIAGGGLAR